MKDTVPNISDLLNDARNHLAIKQAKEETGSVMDFINKLTEEVTKDTKDDAIIISRLIARTHAIFELLNNGLNAIEKGNKEKNTLNFFNLVPIKKMLNRIYEQNAKYRQFLTRMEII